jgi:8-oxo-dGTP diphosphatase
MSEHDFLAASARHPAHRQERVRVAAAVIWDGDRVLLGQRPPGGPLALQWEFPGGKIEAGETPEHALVRELHEELGVSARPLEVLAVETHDDPHGREIEIHFVHCELAGREFRLSGDMHAIRWARPAEVDPASVVAGDRSFLASLVARGA